MSDVKVEKTNVDVVVEYKKEFLLLPHAEARELYAKLGEVLGVECEHLYDDGEAVCRCGEYNRTPPGRFR